MLAVKPDYPSFSCEVRPQYNKSQKESFLEALGCRYVSSTIIHPDYETVAKNMLKTNQSAFEEMRTAVRSGTQTDQTALKLLDLANRYENFLESDCAAPISVHYINPSIGYGCFADDFIPNDTILGEYAGALTKSSSASGIYSIRYQPMSIHISGANHFFGRIADRNILDESASLSIDAEYYGNEMRFINHARPDLLVIKNGHEISAQNVTWKSFFFDGLWRYLIMSTRPIQCGEELRIDYGDAYFKGYHENYDVYQLNDNIISPVDSRLPRERYDISTIYFWDS